MNTSTHAHACKPLYAVFLFENVLDALLRSTNLPQKHKNLELSPRKASAQLLLTAVQRHSRPGRS
jgi:hypothetical protein